jgi:putative peptide zinc metalloprotease protein
MTSSDNLPLGNESNEALPQARDDVEITEQVYLGKPCYILKDPTTLRFYRLRPPEYLIYRMLDGKTTVEDILKALDGRFPAEEYDQQAVMSFLIMLRGANLVHVAGYSQTEYLLKRKKTLTRSIFKKLWAEFLFYRFPLFDPDKTLIYLEQHIGRILFRRATGWAVLAMLIGALALVLSNVDKLGQSQPLLSWINLLYLGGAVLLIKPIHEFGHGLTAKHFGCEVHEMGFLLLVFTPCFYCDVSDAWMIPEKRRRMWITGAGIAVEVVLAGLAAYVWALTEPKTVLNQFALNMMLAAGVNSLMFNGNPLLRYDGYYFLMDLLEIPNLKQKGSGYLWYLIRRWVFRDETAQAPIDVAGREWLVILYAIASAVYRWFIMIAITILVWTFLDPYGFGVVGAIMAIGCIYTSLLVPFGRFIKYFVEQRHSIRIRPVAASVLAGAGAAIIGFVLLIPIEQTVDVQCVLRPAEIHPLYVTQPGEILVSQNPSYVQDGQAVEAHQVLLRLTDPVLEKTADDLKFQIAQMNVQKDRSQQRGDVGEVARINAKIEGLQAQYDQARTNLEKLTLRSPSSGILQVRTKTPFHNLEGSFVPLQTEMMAIYPSGEFDAVAAMSHRDYGQIQAGQKAEVLLWAFDNEVFETQVRSKPPRPVWRLSSPAFSTAFGGEIATMPAASKEEAMEPAENTYELELRLPTDARLRDGMSGRAKIILTKKTLARTVYVWFVRTLRHDIRL